MFSAWVYEIFICLMDSYVLFQSSSVLNSYEAIAFENVNVGSWVIVKYDASFYLRTVLDIASGKKLTKVCCLEKPIAYREPSEMEKERFAVWYKQHQLYTSPSVPAIIKYKRTSKYVLGN